MTAKFRTVRLSEVPLTIRRRAGRRLLEHAAESADLVGALQLQRAIEAPSGRMYRLPAEAVARVLGG